MTQQLGLNVTDRIDRHAVLAVLSRHIGRDQGATCAELVREITRGPTNAHLERQFRQAVVELRRDGHHVCAHPSAGYFLAETDQELDATCDYLYERALCSLEQVAKMKRVSLPDLRGQLRLPT